MNTGNAIKIFDARGLKVMRAVPEKHIINIFGPKIILFYVKMNSSYQMVLSGLHLICKHEDDL